MRAKAFERQISCKTNERNLGEHVGAPFNRERANLS
jgi:hypothetical protein